MTIPALVVADGKTSWLRVATLPIVERLVVAAHRAGCSPITVVAADPIPPMQRARALGIEWERCESLPPLHGPALIAHGNVLVQADDVKRVITSRGRLVTPDGEMLPLGIADGWDGNGSIETAIARAAPVIAARTAAEVTSEADVEPATRAFWRSLKSSTDSLLDRLINRPLGRPLSKLLIRTEVTPNQISLAAMAVGLLGAYFFARGSYAAGIAGALLFQLAAIVDCVDGDVAYAVFKETPIGKWLDITADQVVHVALFLGIAFGLARSGSDAPVAWLGASTAIGTLLSFSVVVRGMLQPPERRNATVAKMIDAVTNRDFSYVLLAMAVLGKLELFLWCTAFGVHVFWIAALAVQQYGGRDQIAPGGSA